MRSNTGIATTDTAKGPVYVGRFAPSPTGDLHLGSLLTAAAGFLEARAHGGRWLLRMEDLDRSRHIPGSAARILRCLESFGLHWDGLVYQSERGELYDNALAELRRGDSLFQCACSRRQLQDEQFYPGTCRRCPPASQMPTATRFRVEPGIVQFDDRVQGAVEQDVAQAVGDFIVRRRDEVIAYVLAVVVDDAAQGVTHVVRGADLLHDTARQILLQRALRLPTPVYAHVPVLTEPDGSKLAKSRRSLALDVRSQAAQLRAVLTLLGLQPPVALQHAPLSACWEWAHGQWSLDHIPRQSQIAVRGQEAS